MFTIGHCLLMVLAVFWGLDINNWPRVEARSTALWPKSNLIDDENLCPRDIGEMDYNSRQKYYNGLIRVKGKALLVDGECKSTENITPAPTKTTTDNCETTSKKPSNTTKPTTENNCETASNTTSTITEETNTTKCNTTEKTYVPIVTLKIYITQKSKEKDKNQDSSCKAKEMDGSDLKRGHTGNKIHKREIKTKSIKRAFRRHRQRHSRRDGKQKKGRRHYGHSKQHRRQPYHHRQLHMDDNPSVLL